jgi:EAL domain-containing protein (putative c-di-GMP-specific phosphodiesterase class I)
VDDAGAGYSSFHHIVQLRPDIIKLDRELVRDVDTDAARRALASAVLLFALELPASVTAEGVETEAQLEALDLLGVDAVQGFHVARPTTSSAVWRSWGTQQFSAALAWADSSTVDSVRPSTG